MYKSLVLEDEDGIIVDKGSQIVIPDSLVVSLLNSIHRYLTHSGSNKLYYTIINCLHIMRIKEQIAQMKAKYLPTR